MTARLRALLKNGDDIFRSSLFEAAAMLRDGARLPAVLRTVVLRELGEFVRAVPYPPLQKEAIEHLRGIGGPAVANILASLATTPSMSLQVRHWALIELRANGCDEALSTNLARNQDIAHHPILAVETAALLADQNLAAQARELLLRVARFRVFTREARARLAECCKEVGLPGLHAALLEILRDRSLNRDIHASVVQLLLAVSPAPPTSDIFKLLSDQEVDAVVRRDLAEAVGQVNDPALPRLLISIIRRPAVHAGVRARLALTLGSLQRADVADEIIELIGDKTFDAGLRSRLASVLGRLKPSHLLGRIVAMMRDETLELPVRRSLARIICSFDDPSLKDQVRELLSDDTLDIGIQARLARSLAVLGDEERAMATMGRLARNPHFNGLIRARIVRELHEVQHPSVPELLRDLLEDTPTTGPLRREIIIGLVRTGDWDAVDELVRYVRQRTLFVEVRLEMIEALSHLEGGGREILLELLTDEHLDGKLRQFVAEKLAALCGPGELARITAIVDDPRQDLAVRVDAGRVLGTVADTSDSVAALTRLLGEVANKYGPVYGALLSICRRTGLSVFPEAVGWPAVRYLS